MKIHNNVILLFICMNIILSVTSCKQKLVSKDKYYDNGGIKEMTKFDKNGSKIVYTFYEDGNIDEIKKYNKNGQLCGQQLWFFPDGILDRQIPMYNDKASGNAYYFYDTTGALRNFRFFRNDKETLYGADYWGDSLDLIKATLHFNDSGQIYYKRNFDRFGKFLSEEGTRE
jgi:hypothetical protein